MARDTETTHPDPWVAEMVGKIDTIPDDEIARTSRVLAALLKTAVQRRPRSHALRRAILADAIGVAAVATREAI